MTDYSLQNGFEDRIAFCCPQDKQDMIRDVVKAILADDYLEDDMIYSEYEAIVKERDDLAQQLAECHKKLTEIKSIFKKD